MENNLLTEITDFKNDVKHNGMVITTYLNKRKEFLQRIELSSDRSLKFFRIYTEYFLKIWLKYYFNLDLYFLYFKNNII